MMADKLVPLKKVILKFFISFDVKDGAYLTSLVRKHTTILLIYLQEVFVMLSITAVVVE
jgi:hypothetical protein